MTERNIIDQTTLPATSESLARDFESLGLETGQTVLLHSSLGSIGYVCGGAQTVITSLLNILGESGTLMMPTHTGQNSDPANWNAPPVPESWWPAIRANSPPFDPRITPTRGMGAIAEMFRQMPGVERSLHPSTSFAACGPNADFLLGGKLPLEEGLGEDSPIGKLYEIDGQILLLGTTHSSNTSLHLAEYRAKLAHKNIVKEGAAILLDEERQWVMFEMLDLDSDDFEQIGTAFTNEIQNRDFFSVGDVGLANASLYQQRPLVDFAVSWMENYR